MKSLTYVSIRIGRLYLGRLYRSICLDQSGVVKSNVFFLREKGAQSELHFAVAFAIKMVLNFLQLYVVCGRTRNFLRLLVDRILNFF